jgi:2-polyprenyl-3-methyl-5-hydroxy-6-metoxy-1,4-benzoquinol methylase
VRRIERAERFWDSVYSSTPYSRNLDLDVVEAARNHFGDLRNKAIIDIGCGPGQSSIYFASQGATVTAVDTSAKAIDDLKAICDRSHIQGVRAMCGSALDLQDLGPVDFVYGSMILHHIEPFDQFVIRLRRALKPGGKAFFYENNARSRLLMWFRRHVAGVAWVPKHGDPDEFPLTPQEISLLRDQFDVEIRYPELFFFRLISAYLLKGAFGRLFSELDRFCYRRKWLLSYSYRQYLLLS